MKIQCVNGILMKMTLELNNVEFCEKVTPWYGETLEFYVDENTPEAVFDMLKGHTYHQIKPVYKASNPLKLDYQHM